MRNETTRKDRAAQPRNELTAALAACRNAIIALGMASALINLLYLSGSVYMLEVYDRVLPSRSVPTLVGLSILVLGLYGFQGVLDLMRGRVLIRIGRSLAERLSSRVFDTISLLALKTRMASDGCSRFATSIRFGASWPASARWHFSTCRGFPSTSASASCSMSGWGSQR